MSEGGKLNRKEREERKEEKEMIFLVIQGFNCRAQSQTVDDSAQEVITT